MSFAITTMRPVEIGRVVRDSSADTCRQIELLVRQDRDAAAWVEQVGPAYTRAQVAELLGVTPQAVAQRKGLLAVRQMSGAVVYPLMQFAGRLAPEAVQKAVEMLADIVATPWTTASWLSTAHDELDGRRPVDVLRDGNADERATALRLTRRLADSLAA